MLTVIFFLAERFGIFVTVAFLLTRFPVFRRFVLARERPREALGFTLLFGAFGILGTYLGLPVQGAIANSRAVFVTTAGLLGGPLVGLGAGLIAGGHRFLIDINGFTGLACGVSTFSEGVIAGLVYHFRKKRLPDWRVALITGLLLEVLQMAIILAIARPFEAAAQLVKVIGIPMIVVNGAGTAIFVLIIETVLRERERAGALQAQKALEIANQTLPYLRGGLSERSAQAACTIILRATNMTAVAMTDGERILAHEGRSADHHRAGSLLQTEATREALANGEHRIARSRAEIGCQTAECALGSAAIVPLRRQEQVIGTLKLYRDKEQEIDPVDLQLALGLAQLFSTQLELAEVEQQKRLRSRAEIMALRAQMNPHFLFNALNTIVSFCRTNPETARSLIISLGEFFRRNLMPGAEEGDEKETVPLSIELEHVRSYMAIEEARYGERIHVKYEVDDDVLGCPVPALVLQPLVENAVKHGLLPREEKGDVVISAHRRDGTVEIAVSDDGVGIPPERMATLLTGCKGRTTGIGLALKNVSRRLRSVYGTDDVLRIESEPGRGTTMTMRIPFATVKAREEADAGAHR
jgi:two-component system sensor histidine kinase LytS